MTLAANFLACCSSVSVNAPVLNTYSFRITWANIYNQDGTNATCIKQSIGETSDEAKHDLRYYTKSLSHIGYAVKSIELID